jgi:hypothetical protein
MVQPKPGTNVPFPANAWSGFVLKIIGLHALGLRTACDNILCQSVCDEDIRGVVVSVFLADRKEGELPTQAKKAGQKPV